MGQMVYLRLRKHIYQPTAYCTVCATGDQVVRVLGPNHLHSIDWVCVASRG